MKTYLMFVVCQVTAVVFILRFLIEPRLAIPTATGSYEALAHLHVGLLVGLWLGWRNSDDLDPGLFPVSCFWQAVAITLLEVVMFAAQKAGGS